MKLLEDYKIITITHHELNVSELGHFVVKHSDENDLKSKLDVLMDNLGLGELVYLATCNRVSYIFTTEGDIDIAFKRKFFKNINPDLSLDILDKLEKYVTSFTGLETVQHVYEVASSMDSLVIGEREIFRQLRKAFDFSSRVGHLGENLKLLERYAVTAAKEVYEKTKIGERPLSIVSLAIEELVNHGLSTDDRILIVGAGETNTLVSKFLVKKGVKHVDVFNRSVKNASHIIDLLGGDAYHLSELKEYARGFDVLIVCTASTDPIITPSIYRSLLQREEDNKIVIDLSVPANVDPEVVSTFNMTYIDIEHLRKRADKNLEFRKSEVQQARKLLREKLVEFQRAHQMRQLEMLLHLVPKQIKEVKQHAVSNVYAKKLERLDKDSLDLVMEMMDYMEKKCISVPMKAAKTLV